MLRLFVMFCLYGVFSLTPIVADDLMSDLQRISHKSKLFQKFFVKHKMKQIQKKYTDWIQNATDQEFKGHLSYSENGAKLLQHLNSESVSLSVLKRKYQGLIDQNLKSMYSIVNKFYGKNRNFTLVYNQAKPYILAFFSLYNALLTDSISHQEFKLEEAKIVEHLKALRLSPLSKQMIRLVIMLQTQEIGLSHNKV
ncbi:hypothetical protein MJH12_05810 [bacterium]|nr:hypothetical protein [bacterium]